MDTDDHAAGADDQWEVNYWKAAVGCWKRDVNCWKSAIG